MNRRQWITRSAAAAAGIAIASPVAARPPLPRTSAHPGRTRNAGTTDDPIRLHSNENPLGPSAPAREAMAQAFAGAWMYPSESYPALIARIAAVENVPEDHVFLGAGSHEVLRTAGTAYGIAGGHLVVPYPTYEAFGVYAESVGAVVERVPLTGSMEVDLEGIAGAVTDDTRLTFICNPNNPTGRIVPSADLRALIGQLDGRCGVLVDEAYHGYVAGMDYESCVPMVRDGADIIVSRTFSKIYGLAGMRVGYAIAQPETVERMMAFRNRHSVSSVAIAAAIASHADEDFVRFSREENDAGRQIVYRAADAAGMSYLESAGNYVFVHVNEPIMVFQGRMLEKGIRVGRPFDPYLDWARISIGTRSEMDRFAEALSQVAMEVGQ